MGTNNNDILRYLALWPRGSEWRKWDLHVHTKADSRYRYDSDFSISNREQNDTEYAKVFIEHVYSINKLGAIAITDHNKGDWLDPIIEENKRRISERGNEGITIFPGVETESHDGIHLLVIFNPDSQSEEVKRSYRKLTWKETIEHFLTAIGVTAGSNSKKTTEKILEEAEIWDALCIFAHVTSDKGFFRHSGGTTKKRVYKHKLTQIFHIPNGGITDVGQQNIIGGKDSNYCDEEDNPKSVSCISASDAKKLKDIATNNCWIKADPTFEGLKQIIYEPDDRRYIGEEAPRKLDRTKIIKSVSISKSNQWFEEDKAIEFNESLVSVIGGKGSGKTAILDLIALATKSYRCYEDDEAKSKSFLKKALRELKGLKIKVEWDEGMPDEITVSDKIEESDEEGKVRYLPQDFIDQLCSEIGKSELEEQIENVIFQKIPPEYKADYADFSSYKKAQLSVINERKDRISNQIEEVNKKIYEYKMIVDSKEKKKAENEKNDADINKLDNEMKKILEVIGNTKNQKDIIDKLNSSIEKKSKLEKKISEFKNKILRANGISNDILQFIDSAVEFVDRIKAYLQIIDVKKEIIDEIKVVLCPINLQEVIQSRKKEIEEEISKLQVDLKKVNEDIRVLKDKITIEKSKQDKIREINESLSILKRKKESLNEEMKKIEISERELPGISEKRDVLFAEYFNLVFEEKEILKEIYSPLAQILQKSPEEDEKLFDFSILFNIDINSMSEEGHKLIDLRAEGKYRQKTLEAFKADLKKIDLKIDLEEKTLSQKSKDSIKMYLEEVKDLFGISDQQIRSQLKRERYTELDFYNWLYSTKYYDISYSIKFNGIELSNLSPGLKGVALLILFLELDKEDKRPILIDQPEENLDNRSIYSTLKDYFRKAKERRQTIIITHNPNLVVNADAEQVIVANFDRGMKKQKSRICYISGSLENTFQDTTTDNVLLMQGIREHVCEILEGGKEAFEKRERKYGFRH